MTPDEVRMLDNRLALLFIRGEPPLMDEKYELLKHPNVKYTTDGGAPAYAHGGTENAVAGLTISRLTPGDLGISDNLVLYGHHMNNGTMFSDLCKYASEDFYREHKTICFDTLDSFGEYEVIAAFKTVAYSGEGFKYYHFVNAESAEAFDEYIAECKALALYDTGVTAEYGDKLITLSTCEYSRTNGRMVVVAKLLDA